MKVNELRFKDTGSTGYSFIRKYLFKEEWQEGADEYNNAVKELISASANTDEFVQKYLANSEWKKGQCYQAMLKKYKPEKIWLFIREMFGDKSRKTISDTGALKIGNENFNVLINDSFGDGVTRYAILNKDEFYAGNLMNYFSIIKGKFNIYSYDCSDDIKEKLEGSYHIYYYEGLIALVDMNQTEEQEHKYSPEIEELVNNIAACSDWAEADSYLDRLIYRAADSIKPYKGGYKAADTKNDIIFYMWFRDNCLGFGAMDNYCQPLDMTDSDWDYAISRYERLQGEEIIKLACNALGVDFGDLL